MFDREGGVLHFSEVAEPFKLLVLGHWKAGIAIKRKPINSASCRPNDRNHKGQAFQELFRSDGRWWFAGKTVNVVTSGEVVLNPPILWRKALSTAAVKVGPKVFESILHHGHAGVWSDLDFDDVPSRCGPPSL